MLLNFYTSVYTVCVQLCTLKIPRKCTKMYVNLIFCESLQLIKIFNLLLISDNHSNDNESNRDDWDFHSYKNVIIHQ